MHKDRNVRSVHVKCLLSIPHNSTAHSVMTVVVLHEIIWPHVWKECDVFNGVWIFSH